MYANEMFYQLNTFLRKTQSPDVFWAPRRRPASMPYRGQFVHEPVTRTELGCTGIKLITFLRQRISEFRSEKQSHTRTIYWILFSVLLYNGAANGAKYTDNITASMVCL